MPRPRNSTVASGSSDGEPSTSLRVPSSLKGKGRDNSGPLQRGSACLQCRKRKLKCDAAKPSCQQCIRGGTSNECSYDNGKALSKTQILQQRIAQLEQKLAQLQGRTASSPESSSSSLANLVDPSANAPGSGPSPETNKNDLGDPFNNNTLGIQTSSPAIVTIPSFLYGDNSGLPPDYGVAPGLISTARPGMSPYIGSNTELYDPIPSWPISSVGQTEIHPSLYSSPAGSTFGVDDFSSGSRALSHSKSLELFSGARTQDPNCITATPEGRQYLYYFDVHVGRFYASLQEAEPRKQPHPCLMDAIYLLACYVSRDDKLHQHEAGLLSRARQGLCDSLEHSDRLWNFVQASTLIAFYLYQNGRFIEAYHQTCQVARFAVSCGLHQIASPFLADAPRESARIQAPWTVTNMSVRRAGSMLEAPKDQIEVGERILAFWHIFLLDRCGSIMTNLPAALPDECDSFSQIETVWPRTLEEYEKDQIYEADYGTVRHLYQPDTPFAVGRADTIFTLRLKASALFERASRLGSRYSASMNEQLFGLFRSVDFAISRFSSTLPYARNSGVMGEIPPTEANAPVNAFLVFVHTLALTATMRLHYVAAMEEPISYSKRLNAAEAVVVVANELIGSIVDYTEFDMLIGHCWRTACDVFIIERSRLASGPDVVALDAKIDMLIGQMQMLQTAFPLTAYQINEVLQSRPDPLSNYALTL